jgi:hypothetical protein
MHSANNATRGTEPRTRGNPRLIRLNIIAKEENKKQTAGKRRMEETRSSKLDFHKLFLCGS